tara:strand:+ start:992 stop:1210 length:219 start_codon:yes stop_codon:yes gene_type:complete
MLRGSGSRSRSGDKDYYYHCNHFGKERFRADASNQVLFDGLNDLDFTKDTKHCTKLPLRSYLNILVNQKNKK